MRRMKIKTTFIISLVLAGLAQAKDNTHLVLMSGQSNMNNMSITNNFQPMLEQAFPDDNVIIVKVAKGGLPIARWVPDGAMYARLIKKTKEATGDIIPDSITFIWMQGERDHQTDETTQSYERNLRTLYTQLVRDLKYEDINWVIGRLSDTASRMNPDYKNHNNWLEIRAIQERVADSMDRAVWIDRDKTNDPKNGVHNNEEGYRLQEKLFAEAAIKLICKFDMDAEQP
jgi:hypothetical protein